MKATILLILVSVLSLAHGPELALAAQGSGVVNRVTFVTSDVSESTASTEFVLVPSMTVGVKTTKKVLIVEFCGESAVDPFQRLRLQAVVDGIALSPSEITFDEDIVGDPNGRQSHCAKFAGRLPPGDHQVSIKYRSAIGGGSVYLDERTLIVLYR